MTEVQPLNDFWNWDYDASRGTLKETHFKYRRGLRAFVEKEMTPFAEQWEEEQAYPLDLANRTYKAGFSGVIWPKEYDGTPMQDFDAFHDQIFWEEVIRCGTSGTVIGSFYIASIGLPPLIAAGIKDKKKNKEVISSVVRGEKFICLAVTEPTGGSDVAAIQTIAKDDGDSYVVNGSKTFISGGMVADYFTTAVRTSDSALSLLLLEKGMPGIHCRRLKTQGWESSHTTAIIFENVRVPKANLIGMENHGFKYIMQNFNSERWRGGGMAISIMRLCLEDSIDYARTRKTFGVPIIDHQVIRHKIGEMISRVMNVYALLESITARHVNGCPMDKLAGPIAILKMTGTTQGEYVIREACQIFGGRAYLRGGRGGMVERFFRDHRINAVGGGTQEIMIELATRMAKL